MIISSAYLDEQRQRLSCIVGKDDNLKNNTDYTMYAKHRLNDKIEERIPGHTDYSEMSSEKNHIKYKNQTSE